MTAPEFKHTMKVIISPGGRMIPAIRASARRTGDKGCSGVHPWYTPTAHDDASGNPGANMQQMLPSQAKLAAWPTPDATMRGPAADPQSRIRPSGCRKKFSLQDAAELVAPPPPPKPGGGLRKLEDQADGAISISCPAGMGKRGVLNPNLSRWLMGYPLSWTLCGMLAFLKTKSARRSARSRSPSTPSGA